MDDRGVESIFEGELYGNRKRVIWPPNVSRPTWR